MSGQASNPKVVADICKSLGNDRTRMMDIVRAVQEQLGCVDGPAMDAIAAATGAHRVEVEGVVTFYAFLSEQPKGKVAVRVSGCVPCRMGGAENVMKGFIKGLGIQPGQTTPDGKVSLEWTSCIGMCDQGPAALINDTVVTYLSGERAKHIAAELLKQDDPRQARLVSKLGDGNNASDLVRSAVHNNVRMEGAVIFAPSRGGDGLRKALAMTPQEVIRDVKTARLRGRGGAGFPTGMKWEFTRAADGTVKYVVCNADEGEPGTFKDRVLLTEKADLLFEGMAIAGYAIGAETGILYLRGEYAYLRKLLEDALAKRRLAGLLGRNVAGKQGFHFDIRIQMGAGAYICGEETALISSAEGQRGDPKTRPPFPAQKGYLGCPTAVNNVETFCCVTRVLEMGPGWFAQMGSKGSPGTKLLSISGDCARPGVYEVPFGISLSDLLKMAGADDAQAVQVGGPSGQMVGPDQFSRCICYDEVATGGSVIVIGRQRDLLRIVSEFMEFFVEESCGYCTPCRVGNVLLKQKLDQIRAGKGVAGDLDYLQQLGETIKTASRCGLGQTSPNPVLTTLKNFRKLYEAKLTTTEGMLRPTFDPKAALREAVAIAGRGSSYLHD
jgi:[NiFe] hydrogenase diaphorase moiety large subunit